ncbi:hypothetical protein KCU77_g9, partial [Aureobasidium melanogenum]
MAGARICRSSPQSFACRPRTETGKGINVLARTLKRTILYLWDEFLHNLILSRTKHKCRSRLRLVYERCGIS